MNKQLTHPGALKTVEQKRDFFGEKALRRGQYTFLAPGTTTEYSKVMYLCDVMYIYHLEVPQRGQ